MEKKFRWNERKPGGQFWDPVTMTHRKMESKASDLQVLQDPDNFMEFDIIRTLCKVVVELAEIEEARTKAEFQAPTEEELSRAASEGWQPHVPAHSDRLHSVLQSLATASIEPCKHCKTMRHRDDYCPKCGR